jgi:Beta-propeller repeat/Abnormal spindle-like microcephaly-assoc'd, ASPM-SPD-2-Hydin
VVPATKGRSLATPPPPRTTAPAPTAAAAMSFKLVGANTNPTVVGEKLQTTKVNYFIGNDRSKWLTNIATYGQVRYKNVYPGIDLVYYGTQRQVEYDFDVAPGADATQIQFAVQGADSLSIDDEGNLVLKKGTGELHFQSPVVYQLSAGQRVKVPGAYAVGGSNRVGFTVKNYDSSKPLVIDPVLIYSTFLGGSSYDGASAIAIDSTGEAYVTGMTQSPNFPLANFGTLPPGGNYIFVSKLDVSGTTLLWADYVCGTSGSDYPAGIAVDTQGNAYITGTANSSDFPTVNAYQATMDSAPDAFLAKLSTDGSQLLYSTYLGGSNWEQANGVAVDSTGSASIAGTTASLDFPVLNAFQSTANPGQGDVYGDYGFVAKFSADGSTLVFSTYLAGSQVDWEGCDDDCAPYSTMNGVAVDANGNVYIAGETDTTDFPVSDGAYMSENPTGDANGNETSFIASFTPSGSLNYSTYFGGSEYTYVYGLTVDSSDAAYITGNSPADGSFTVTNSSICDQSDQTCGDAFVAKLNSTGTEVIYSTFLGPNNNTQGTGIQVDPAGNAYVLAYFGNSSYVLTNPIEANNNTGGVLIDEIDPTGSTELFSTFLGGSSGANAVGMAVDASSSIYVTGATGSDDFPVVQSAFQGTNAGNNDVFISKITQATAPAFTIYPSLLQFSTRVVGTTSQAETATLRNMGTAALTINSQTMSGDFAETDTCNGSVAAASSCTFTITFAPTAPGSRFGTLTFGDNAAGSPHFINMVGDGSAPLATITPASLTFASAAVNTTSAAQTITLSNTGNATLNISDVQITGAFAQTNNCPPGLSFGSSCQFQVTFTPTTGGALTGSLTLTDDAPDSPQTIALSGSGFVTTATVSPATLVFGNQNVSAASAAQVVTITNTGESAMTVSGVTAPAGYSQTNNCGTVAVSGTCTISVTFTPTASGSTPGTLVINDNAQGNPHAVSLTGMGIAGTANLSASNLTFASSNVGSTSTAQNVTITNSGNGPLTVSSIQATGDFAQTNNCSTVAVSSTCTVQVTFTPSASGSRTGTLIITSSAIGGPQTVTLSGSGVDFSMPATGGSSTIQAGGTATYQLNVAPLGGSFSNTVTLACQGVPAFATCSIKPTTVTPGANGANVTVTVTTDVAASNSQSKGRAGMLGFWISGGFGLFGVVWLGSGRGKSKRLLAGMGLALFMTMTLALVGCGSGSSHTTQSATAQTDTPKGTYTLIVVGTSGSAQHFSSLTMVVQ